MAGQPSKQLTKFFKTNRNAMQWFVFDAKGKTLGRLASEVAKILRGKHRPEYTPNSDMGDGVIIINAKEVKVTGAKEAQKIYYSHSGFVGGLKEVPYRRMMQKRPEFVIEHAVKGMMPKTKLGRAAMKKLRVYAEDKHDLKAQNPMTVSI